jgi:signal transduction histidine kinase/CheY-like chemotaxis protein/HPt (histidine-containing phosphotransfer) domain-containing protein
VKLSTKLILASILSSLIFIACILIVNIQQRKVSEGYAFVIQSDQVIMSSAKLQKLILDMETGLRGYLLTVNNDHLELYSVATQVYPDALQNLVNIVQDDPEHLKSVQDIDSLLVKWRARAEEVINTKKLGADTYDDKGKAIIDKVRAEFNQIEKREDYRHTQRFKEKQASIASANQSILILGVASIVFVTLLSTLIIKSVFSRINKIVHWSQDIASGNFEANISAVAKDELTTLAMSLNTISVKLKDVFDSHLAAEVQALESERKLRHHIKETERELLKTKQLLEESEGVKKMFLANISHEIRTPMNAIIGFTELLSKSVLDKDQDEYVKAIKFSGDNLLVLLNEILDFSAIEAGKIKLEQISFKLAEVLNNAAKNFESTAKQTGIELKIKVADNIPEEVIGDPYRLYQVLLHLMSNAFKFTEKGYVSLEAECIEIVGHEALLSFKVADSGIGISAEKMSEIFEGFTQLDTTTTRKNGGTGLGLCIVKNLVEMQGGNITVKSTVGEGSVFTFLVRYKISSCQEPTPAVEVKRVDKEYEGTVSVLIVEDNQLNQLLATKILGKGNYSLDIADNGRIAIEKLKKNRYDIVLMDIRMPEMDGFETTYHIRNIMPEPVCNIPIIAITANVIKGELERCLEAGMDDYISKPFKADELINKISQWIDSSQSTQSIDSNAEKDTAHIYVDLTYLKMLCNNESDFMKEMILTYFKSADEFVERVNDALQAKDYNMLGELAHKMKSATLIVGIEALEEPMEKIEKFSFERFRLNEIPVLADMVKDIIRQSVKELELELEKL